MIFFINLRNLFFFFYIFDKAHCETTDKAHKAHCEITEKSNEIRQFILLNCQTNF